jgi:hypothetical protein
MSFSKSRQYQFIANILKYSRAVTCSRTKSHDANDKHKFETSCTEHNETAAYN